MDDQCPVCKSDRYLNPKLRLLVSSCYHKMSAHQVAFPLAMCFLISFCDPGVNPVLIDYLLWDQLLVQYATRF